MTDENYAHYKERFSDPAIAEKYFKKRNRRKDAGRANFRFEASVIADVAKLLDEGATVLDIPCGGGTFVSEIEKHGLQYWGSDIAQPMLNEVAKQGVAVEHLVKCDAENTPFEDGQFDCIFDIHLLHHIADRSIRVSIMKELGRISNQYVLVYFRDRYSLSSLCNRLKSFLRRKPFTQNAVSLREAEGELTEAGLIPVRPYRHMPFFKRDTFFLAKVKP